MSHEVVTFSSHPHFQSHSRTILLRSPAHWDTVPSPLHHFFPSFKETEWRTAGGLIHRLYRLFLQPAVSAKTTELVQYTQFTLLKLWAQGGVWESLGRQQGRCQGQERAGAKTGLGGPSPSPHVRACLHVCVYTHRPDFFIPHYI